MTPTRDVVARALDPHIYGARDHALAVEAVLAALGLSDGTAVIVPVEPTEAMLDAGDAALLGCRSHIGEGFDKPVAPAVFAAMLAKSSAR